MYYLPLILGVFMNAWSGNYMRKRAESRLSHPYTPLPDVLHDCFPKIPVMVPDIFLFMCMMMVVYNRAYLVDMERHVFNIGMCSIIRSFSVCLTTSLRVWQNQVVSPMRIRSFFSIRTILCLAVIRFSLSVSEKCSTA